MKLLFPLMIAASVLCAEDLKSLPNQAGNGNIDIAGTALVDKKDIQQALGAELEPGYIVVRIKVSPRTLDALRISADDFTLISRKDGERCGALSPSQIANPPTLVLKRSSSSGGGLGTSAPRPPVFGLPSTPGGIGTAPGQQQGVEAVPSEGSKNKPENPLLKVLESKILKDVESKEPVEGLLYFLLEGKNKPKDLGLVYAGPAGRLAMDFK